jgi:SIR2-like domain
MKSNLTVLLGAGSTIGTGVEGARGMPSTDDLTRAVSSIQFPKIVLYGTPFLTTQPQDVPHRAVEVVPAIQMVQRALLANFSQVNFELILHAIEQLLPLTTTKGWAPYSDLAHPALAAFIELERRHELLRDWSLLRTSRDNIILKIISEIENRKTNYISHPPLARFITTLRTHFNISVFTLNYDDVVDEIFDDWLDGFGDKDATVGELNGRKFQPAELAKSAQSQRPLLIHMHGSVRFGPGQGLFQIVQYDNIKEAKNAIKSVATSDTHVRGQVITATPIISGYNKAARLALNPAPYGYYFRLFIDKLLSNERLIVVGYGGGDEHINTWLNEYKTAHGERRRTVWVGLLNGTAVGTRSSEKNIIALLSDSHFRDALHYDKGLDDLFDCGSNLLLGAEGFPFGRQSQSKLVSYLT